jgi:hypothetical protein
MSFYNMIHGVNPATFFVLPMLGRHAEEYPRFRDCFLGDDDHPEYNDHIHVYTRVGGGNRGAGFGEEEIMKHPNFVTTYDDSFDSTYGTYVFSVPEEWRADFELIKEGRLKEISMEYQDQVRKIYPKLQDKLDQIWPPDTP